MRACLLHTFGKLICLFLFACLSIVCPSSRAENPADDTVSAETLLSMQVGEVRVLGIPGVARVAVGDGKILNAVSTDDKEVIVFARKSGFSTLHAWTAGGERLRYAVEVVPEGTRQLRDELKTVLERIDGVRATPLGDKLLVEGDNLSDSDRLRLQELGQRYPQLLDLTGTVGWEQMVLLDVQVVELPRNVLQELGVRWTPRSIGGVNTGLAWDTGSTRYADRPGESVVPIVFPQRQAAGYFGVSALLSAQIDMLAQKGHALVLAQPQLLARSGATAEFLAGGEVPYSTVDGNGNTQTSFKSYGVGLKITPTVERNGAVRSRVEVEVSSIDPSFSVPSGPSLKTRRTATEFNVRTGQTLVLAGFLSREKSRHSEQIPGLGDLPLFGPLFRSTRSQQTETELVVLVTPHLVHAEHPGMRGHVDRTQAILQHQFPAKNTLIRSMGEEPPGQIDASAGASGAHSSKTLQQAGWNPRAPGPSSQWRGATVSSDSDP